MDVDDHPTIKKAISQAKDNGLVPIVSNQCFELWYLLHFATYSTSYIHRTDIVKRLKIHLGTEYDKADRTICEILEAKGNEELAIQKAQKLRKSAEDDSFERDPLRNPSTDVYLLIETLNKIAK